MLIKEKVQKYKSTCGYLLKKKKTNELMNESYGKYYARL